MDFQYMWAIWLAIFVVMVIIEASGPALVSIWFAAGALVALGISFIPGATWWIQLIVFIVVSVVTLLVVRPISKKYFKRNTIKSNIDTIVGKKGLVLEDISFLQPGSCKIGDVVWTAIPSDEKDKIYKDEVIEVVAVNGNKLIVKKVEVN